MNSFTHSLPEAWQLCKQLSWVPETQVIILRCCFHAFHTPAQGNREDGTMQCDECCAIIRRKARIC